MNRKITKILTTIIAATMLIVTSGCANNNSNSSESSADTTSAESLTEIADETANETVQLVYEYEQELNVIDDNYRNYYEIFVRSFYDSDGNGIGDLKGITMKLDYIEEMGFNGIWLMPINPSTTYHKYDVIDYYDIDEQYGTLDDFKELLAECEKRNIKLIIDFVFNHTSAENEWFITATDYLKGLGDGEINLDDCKYAGYYNFEKDASGRTGWHQVSGTDWYYECMFWDQMPDLNLDNTDVRTEIENIAKYWLDMGVGGFRLDAAKEFFSGMTEKNTEILNWFCSYVTSVDENAYIVAEVWESQGTIAEYYKSGITSLFDFPMSQYSGEIIKLARNTGTAGQKSLPEIMANLNEAYGASNPNFIDAPFVSNHDTGRIANACVNDETQIKLAAGLLLTMNGSPFVYYGEEIGLNSKGDLDENKRLPMNWSATDTEGITIKPENADIVEQKHDPLDEQLSNPLSIANYYKRAIRIRNENPEIARGTVEVLETGNEAVSGAKKTWNDSSIEIYYNLTDTVQTISVSTAIRGYLAVDSEIPALDGGTLTLPPYSIVFCK